MLVGILLGADEGAWDVVGTEEGAKEGLKLGLALGAMLFEGSKEIVGIDEGL
jgi:hypothetical protein